MQMQNSPSIWLRRVRLRSAIRTSSMALTYRLTLRSGSSRRAGAIANLKRLCTWLEELRKRYNDKYVAVKGDVSITLDMTGGGGALDMTSPSLSSRPSAARGEISQMRP